MFFGPILNPAVDVVSKTSSGSRQDSNGNIQLPDVPITNENYKESPVSTTINLNNALDYDRLAKIFDFNSLGKVFSDMNNQNLQNDISLMQANQNFNSAEALKNRQFQSAEALKNRNFQASQAQKAMDFERSEASVLRNWQEMMSNTAYQRAVQDMEKAGLNPILAYTQGGATVPSGASGKGFSASGSSASGSQASSGYSQSKRDTASDLFGALIGYINSISSLRSSEANRYNAETNRINSDTKKMEVLTNFISRLF